MKAPTVYNLWNVMLLAIIEFRADAHSSEQAHFPFNQVLIKLFIDTSLHQLSASPQKEVTDRVNSSQ